MENPRNEIKIFLIPFSLEERQKDVSDFEKRTGLILPTDEVLAIVVENILVSEGGKWKKTIPNEIIALLEKTPDDITDSNQLLSLKNEIVSFCYDQSAAYSSLTISRLFGLCILKIAWLWSKKNYFVSVVKESLARFEESIDQTKKEDIESKLYITIENQSKLFFHLLQEPLECISKACFGDADIKWHDSDFSVLAINAIIRVCVEMKKNDRVLLELMSNKSYSIIRGSRGAFTPARKEYQSLVFKQMSLEKFLK